MTNSNHVSNLNAALSYQALGDWAYECGYTAFNQKKWDEAKNWYLLSNTFFERGTSFMLAALDRTIQEKQEKKKPELAWDMSGSPQFQNYEGN